MRLALSALLIFVVSASNAQQADSARLANRPGLVAWTTDYSVAAGLADLEIGPHTPGDREIRIWIGFGITVPDDGYRIVEHNGVLHGEYMQAWRIRDAAPPSVSTDSTGTAAIMRYYRKGRCTAIRRGPEAEVCIARLTKEPPWQKIWHTIDLAGVWVLPDASTLTGERMMNDGWGIVVETWDGHAYRTWSYSNPDYQPWPEAKRATAIARAFDTVSTLMRLSDREVLIRGKALVRADTIEFWGCDGRGPWMLEGGADSLRAAARRMGSARSPGDSLALYFEARAFPTPSFLARIWWQLPERFTGALEPDSTISVRPWAPELCKR